MTSTVSRASGARRRRLAAWTRAYGSWARETIVQITARKSLAHRQATPDGDLYSPAVSDPERQWFFDHYTDAADQIIHFLGGDGLTLEGRTVADIGAGDGIIDL